MRVIQLTDLQSVDGSKKDDLYFKIVIDGDNENAFTVPSKPTYDHSWYLKKGETIGFVPSSLLQDGTVIKDSELRFEFNKQIDILLYDKDNNDDDLLGTVTVTSSYSTGLGGNGFKPSPYSYILSYELS